MEGEKGGEHRWGGKKILSRGGSNPEPRGEHKSPRTLKEMGMNRVNWEERTRAGTGPVPGLSHCATLDLDLALEEAASLAINSMSLQQFYFLRMDSV